MTRPLRLEFSGAVYHVTSRGDRQQTIYQDDADHAEWLEILGLVCLRFNFIIHGFCQMTNHYHLLIETCDGNLSQGMRQLNGLYSQYFNRRHKLVGHLFQGRYKAILVQEDPYLRELIRYVALNPLRAKIVLSLDQWRWSSYHFLTREEELPRWLDPCWSLEQTGRSRSEAVRAYHDFVMAGVGMNNPIKSAQHQLLLGDDAFIASHQSLPRDHLLREVSKIQRRAIVMPLADYHAKYPERDVAMAKAYFSTAYTMMQIAEYFRVSYRTVSRAVRRLEKN